MIKQVINSEYKKELRLKLFYYLDVVGLDYLDMEQQDEFEKIVVELGIRKDREDFC